MARSRGRRTDYQWSGSSGSAVGVGATQALASGGVTINAPGTIVRIRGHVSVQMDVGAADDSIACAVGIIVVNDDALAIGATAIPSPSDDLDADWIWHGWFALRAMQTSNEGLAGGAAASREIDSKAMRRVKQNDNLAVMFDNNVLTGSPTADLTYGIRALLAS